MSTGTPISTTTSTAIIFATRTPRVIGSTTPNTARVFLIGTTPRRRNITVGLMPKQPNRASNFAAAPRAVVRSWRALAVSVAVPVVVGQEIRVGSELKVERETEAVQEIEVGRRVKVERETEAVQAIEAGRRTVAGKPGNGPGLVEGQPLVAVVEVDGAQDQAPSRGSAKEARRVTRARAGPQAGRAVEEELEVVEAAALVVAVEVAARVAAVEAVEDVVAAAEDAGKDDNCACLSFGLRRSTKGMIRQKPRRD
jgi:hypothetical protein